jgi:type II secretory pathway pseudopilin PulG
VLESVVALAIIFLVLVGLLGTLASASKGIVTARQRNIAIGLANQVIETARAVSYDTIGLSTADTSIGTDAAIVSGQFEAAPITYASPSSSSPWPNHLLPQTVGGTVYLTKVYVTLITPSGANAGDPYKKVTVLVDWSGSGRAQYATTAIAASVKLSSLVFPTQLPADPLLQGLAAATGGSISISGTVDNLAISEATVGLPRANSELSSQFVKTASADAQSASVDLTGNLNLYASGANASLITSTHASSPPVKVASAADNDAGTSAPDNSSASSSDAGGSIGRSNTLDLLKGASSSLYAKSTARATSAAGIGDDDLLPYTTSNGAGPASVTMPFYVSPLTGSTATGSVLTSGVTNVTTVIDRDDSGSSKTVLGQASVAHPATSLLTFANTPLNLLGLPLTNPFTGFVKIGSTGTVTASANAGPGVAGPSVTTGGAFDVCVYDTLSNPLGSGTCPAGYKRLSVTPGTAGSLTAHASLQLLGASVSLDATVTSGTPSVTSTLSGSDYQKAEASLVNWLKVVVDLSISTGTTLHVELDYGQITARSKYCNPTNTAFASCVQAAL